MTSKQLQSVDNIDTLLSEILERSQDPGIEIPDHIVTPSEFVEWIRSQAESDHQE